jgi:hypothetical protein
MKHLFSFLAFASLIAAQFLGVLFVAHKRAEMRQRDKHLLRFASE